jgi:hypothetical protein
MSQVRVNTIVDANSGNTAQINGFTPSISNMAGRNRIINGEMRIDQRNAGASVTPSGLTVQYPTVDRWATVLQQDSKISLQRSTVAPAGFTSSLLITSLSAYSVLTGDRFVIRQLVEGFNVADFGWGAASAQSITVSFWVRSSLTGNFGGAISNSATDRSYPFSYAVSSANTWEYKTVTIPGDTTGTWLTDNGIGLRLVFSLGAGATFSGTAGAWASGQILQPTGSTSVVGTNGATFYITGAQLEAGSTATPFERRPFGTELALCQRYYYRQRAGVSEFYGMAQCISTVVANGIVPFPVPMRAKPSALEQSGTASDYQVNHSGITTLCSIVPAHAIATFTNGYVTYSVASGLTLGRAAGLQSAGANSFLAWSAEL